MAFCTYCGTEVSTSAPTCPKCGHPQGVAAHSTAVATRGSGPRTEGTAIASLILGIAGLTVCPFVPSVIALILGTQAKAKIAADPSLEGLPLAKTGVILGWVGIGLAVLGVIAVVLLIVFSSGNFVEPDFTF